MVSRKHVCLAIFVTAVATDYLCRIGFKEILKKVNDEHKLAEIQAFTDGFDAGSKAALDDRYLIARTYMKNAMLMEIN